MPGTFQFSVNDLQYRKALNDLVRVTRANAKLLLDEEARLLIRDIVGATPPDNKAQGAKAVAADLSKVYATAQGFVGKAAASGDHVLAAALSRALNAGDWQEFSDILSGTTGGKVTTNVRSYNRNGVKVSSYSQLRTVIKPKFANWSGQGKIGGDVDPSLHLRRRTRYGRISGTRISQIVINPASLAKYVKSVQDRVGWAKAGWNKAARDVGLRLPNWITKLSGARGGITRTPAPNVSVTITNSASKIPNYQRVVNYALNARYKSLIREAARILQGGKSRRGSFAGTATGSKG